MIPKSCEVCAVVLVYGDRPNVLKLTLDSLRTEGIDEIVLVANVVSNRVKQVIEDTMGNSFLAHEVVYSSENLGTAGGYSLGIEVARSRFSPRYLWLLDDDNRPQSGTRDALVRALNKVLAGKALQPAAVCAYRPAMSGMRRALQGAEADLLKAGSFCGFHIVNLLGAGRRKVESDRRATVINSGDGKLVPIKYAPYGGLFFEPQLIDQIGLPDGRLFLFGDDTEFTYRIARKGGSLYLVSNAIVEDLEPLSHQAGGGRSTLVARFNRPEGWKVLLEVRNRAYLSRIYRNKKAITYYFNGLIYCGIILACGVLMFRPRRAGLILKAIYRGHAGQLGPNRSM